MTEPGLTDAEKLTAVETYMKTLGAWSTTLRAQVTKDLGERHVEKIGAYLPDGTKLGSVAHSKGRKTAKVTDQAAALRWCADKYPGEIVAAINPAFVARLLEVAKAGQVGEPGVDPFTGEVLDFIEVVQGNPFVTVTTTDEGVDRMAALAGGFSAMLDGARQHGHGGSHVLGFADRLENGAGRPDPTGALADVCSQLSGCRPGPDGEHSASCEASIYDAHSAVRPGPECTCVQASDSGHDSDCPRAAFARGA